MPFLRVLRDKRGYETTYLMHWFRGGTRQVSRILYVFRTPPGIRVGRHVFEPHVMRGLEARYPDVEFDWRSLVDSQQVIDTQTEPRRPRKPRKRETPDPAPDAARQVAPASAAAEPSPEDAEVPVPPAAERRPPPIPSALEGATPGEQMEWLRTWYVNVRDRIPHRTHDPARREALMALAERLNPDPWSGEEAVAEGLRHAADALQRLSHVFSGRRRRSRRTGRPRPAGNGSTPA